MKNDQRLNTYRGKFNATAFFVILGLFGGLIGFVVAIVWTVIRFFAWLQE